MNAFISLRILSLLGFLLLMAPFYDACNGKGMKSAEASAEVALDSISMNQGSEIIVKDSNPEISNQTFTTSEHEVTQLEKAYNFVDDENTLNGFEFANASIDLISEILETNFQKNVKEFKESKIVDIFGFFVNFLFVLIIAISILMICISFFDKIKLLKKLALLNFIFILITLFYILLFDPLFEEISQIKWGYYVFVSIQMIIFLVSDNILKSNAITS
jgi:hypothetical protein